MWNTLSCAGGPTLNLESPLLQLFQIHSPGVLGTSGRDGTFLDAVEVEGRLSRDPVDAISVQSCPCVGGRW
jgi:hypothetical protein